jgi:hypothetical protein
MKTAKIKISKLSADYSRNVRFTDNYGNISELADNIAAKGLLVPLIVEPLDSGGYGIISGHRRYAAIKLLIDQGRMTDADEVICTVQTYADELARTAGKLLANDGQPLTADEWACEIARLADAIREQDGDFILTIANGLGKRPEYVKQMYDTWSKLGAGAKAAIQTGKVGMTLAVLVAKKAGSDKLASLSVEIAAAAKEQVKAAGKNVSDAVVADAVVMTTNKVMSDIKSGNNVTGQGIGAELLQNILKAEGARKAASESKRAVLSGGGSAPTSKVERFDFYTYFIEFMAGLPEGDNKQFMQSILMGYNNKQQVNKAA